MLKRIAFAAILSTVVSAVASDARGVILYSQSDRNTDPPSSAEGLDAWNLQAAWGNFLATPIDATHFIASKHVNYKDGETTATIVSFSGTDYQVNTASRVVDQYSDLCVYSISGGVFSSYAALYDASVDGSEIGKTLTVIGRGTQRGAEVFQGGELKGWKWGSSDHIQSWGQNVVSDFADFKSSSPDSLLYFLFDGDGVDNESALSSGDSSGGVFIYSNGQWKLAGINYAIDSPFSLTGDAEDEGFNADIFDVRGLYYKESESGPWVLFPEGEDFVPTGSYASRISARLDWIHAAVPEPSTTAMLISAGAFLSTFVFRRLRGKTV
ncbi:MAG: PEP-CTERM sorting domain-containing protein [Pirellulales bacterium]|nr:PEP-CTERM sorting domain-containing protein [Pirellulales bacterium]